MNPTDITVALIALFGVIISVMISSVVSFRQTKQEIANLKLELQSRYTSKLFEKRLEVYPRLYKITVKLIYAMNSGKLTPDLIKEALDEFYEWDGENAIFVSLLTLQKMISFRRVLTKRLKTDIAHLNQPNIRKEFFNEALALEAAIKTEIGIFSTGGFHSPFQAVDLRKLSDLLEEARKDDDTSD